LCPVPCEHMDAALETCARERRVAFGSQMMEMFYDKKAAHQLIPRDTRVLICVSRSGNQGDAFRKYHKDIVRKCASYEALFVQWQCADSRGEHRKPQYRPASTLGTDTAFMGFWEVSCLRRLSAPIKLQELWGVDTKKRVADIPRHPMRVDARAA
jgi:hypothetical protein